MRILFLSTWFPFPQDNGSKIRVFHLLKALSRRHEVSLVSFAFGPTTNGQMAVAKEMLCSVDTVNINPFEANRVGAARRFLSITPVFTRAIPAMRAVTRRKLGENAYEVVVASGAVMERYALEAPGSTFKTLEEHNSLSMMMHERYRSGRTVAERLQYWLSWQKTRRYERALFGRFDLVTLVSEPDRTYSEQYVHGSDVRVSVIPNGVDCEWNSTGEAPVTGCSLIYSGAMTYGANYDAVQYFLKEIYPVVKAGVPDVIFRVTGSTNGVRLEDLNLDQSVELTGHVEDIRSVVAGATVCVIPLREGGGTRLKILEAMALGTPVVSTSKGAEGLNVVAGEHLLIADDAASFAREIGRLLGDEAMRERLARNGRKLVEAQYDWRKIGREYSDLVERAVLAKKGS